MSYKHRLHIYILISTVLFIIFPIFYLCAQADEDLLSISVGGDVRAVDLSVGGSHACVVLETGEIKCWGSNNDGRLGDGTTKWSSEPVYVSGINNAISVSAGSRHTCAVLENGEVMCWGYNWKGQLGDGTSRNQGNLTPITVSNITNAISVNAGFNHTCAVLETREVQCWGEGRKLGDGTTNGSSEPVSVIGITNAVSVGVRFSHTCAMLETGKIKCWGSNTWGELGFTIPTYVPGAGRSLEPVFVDDITNAVSVGVGSSHTCAVLETGEIKCWGRGLLRRLGNESVGSSNSSTPLSVLNINNAVSVSAGSSHTCATLETGEVKCWGSSSLGDSEGTRSSYIPISVFGITDAVSVGAGYGYSCALLENGGVKCWGKGYGSTPTVVSGLSGSDDVRHDTATISDDSVSRSYELEELAEDLPEYDFGSGVFSIVDIEPIGPKILTTGDSSAPTHGLDILYYEPFPPKTFNLHYKITYSSDDEIFKKGDDITGQDWFSIQNKSGPISGGYTAVVTNTRNTSFPNPETRISNHREIPQEEIDEFLRNTEPPEELRARQAKGEIWDLKLIWSGEVGMDEWSPVIKTAEPPPGQYYIIDVITPSGRVEVKESGNIIGIYPGENYRPVFKRRSMHYRFRGVDHPKTPIKVWFWVQDSPSYERVQRLPKSGQEKSDDKTGIYEADIKITLDWYNFDEDIYRFVVDDNSGNLKVANNPKSIDIADQLVQRVDFGISKGPGFSGNLTVLNQGGSFIAGAKGSGAVHLAGGTLSDIHFLSDNDSDNYFVPGYHSSSGVTLGVKAGLAADTQNSVFTASGNLAKGTASIEQSTARNLHPKVFTVDDFQEINRYYILPNLINETSIALSGGLISLNRVESLISSVCDWCISDYIYKQENVYSGKISADIGFLEVGLESWDFSLYSKDREGFFSHRWGTEGGKHFAITKLQGRKREIENLFPNSILSDIFTGVPYLEKVQYGYLGNDYLIEKTLSGRGIKDGRRIIANYSMSPATFNHFRGSRNLVRTEKLADLSSNTGEMNVVYYFDPEKDERQFVILDIGITALIGADLSWVLNQSSQTRIPFANAFIRDGLEYTVWNHKIDDVERKLSDITANIKSSNQIFADSVIKETDFMLEELRKIILGVRKSITSVVSDAGNQLWVASKDTGRNIVSVSTRGASFVRDRSSRAKDYTVETFTGWFNPPAIINNADLDLVGYIIAITLDDEEMLISPDTEVTIYAPEDAAFEVLDRTEVYHFVNNEWTFVPSEKNDSKTEFTFTLEEEGLYALFKAFPVGDKFISPNIINMNKNSSVMIESEPILLSNKEVASNVDFEIKLVNGFIISEEESVISYGEVSMEYPETLRTDSEGKLSISLSSGSDESEAYLLIHSGNGYANQTIRVLVSDEHKIDTDLDPFMILEKNDEDGVLGINENFVLKIESAYTPEEVNWKFFDSFGKEIEVREGSQIKMAFSEPDVYKVVAFVQDKNGFTHTIQALLPIEKGQEKKRVNLSSDSLLLISVSLLILVLLVLLLYYNKNKRKRGR